MVLRSRISGILYGFSPGYYIVFLTALVLRILFLLTMLSQSDSNRLFTLSPDVTNYLDSSTLILEQFDFNSIGVKLFGPGYPVWLAFQKVLIGSNPIVLTLMQMIVSSLGSVLLSLFAFKITNNRRVALIAGLLNAVSLMSISLSCILLSETMFFSMMLLGMCLFISGLEKHKFTHFIVAGIIFGVASLTRSVAQYFFVILIVLALFHFLKLDAQQRRIFRKRLWLPAITILVMIGIVGTWTVRNEHTHGFAQPALAGYGGMKGLTILARAEINGTNYNIELENYKQEMKIAGIEHREYDESFTCFITESFSQVLIEHPWLTSKAYIKSVISNSNTEWGIHYGMFPEWHQPLRNITSWFEKKGLNYRIAFFSLIGLFIVLRGGNYCLGLLLASIYLYFALLSGFSVWQGARIFYPGQMSWTILIAIAIDRLYIYSQNRRSQAIEACL